MQLLAYPGNDFPEGLRIEADASWTGKDLELRFSVDRTEDVANLRFPGFTREQRDGLWKTTCFECFLTSSKISPAYYEINLSPGGDWAFYSFASYREGMRAKTLPAPPSLHQKGNTWEYRIDLSREPALLNEALSVSLSSVIESRSGTISYWSLKHSAPKPDFHRLDHFVHVLPPKE